VLLASEAVPRVANVRLFGIVSYVPERGRLIHASKSILNIEPSESFNMQL